MKRKQHPYLYSPVKAHKEDEKVHKKIHKLDEQEEKLHEREEKLHKVAEKAEKKSKRKKDPKPDGKIETVMHEFKEGQLHSGSKKGPKVKSRKQAVAIALSEARKAGEKVKVFKRGKMAKRMRRGLKGKACIAKFNAKHAAYSSP